MPDVCNKYERDNNRQSDERYGQIAVDNQTGRMPGRYGSDGGRHPEAGHGHDASRMKQAEPEKRQLLPLEKRLEQAIAPYSAAVESVGREGKLTPASEKHFKNAIEHVDRISPQEIRTTRTKVASENAQHKAEGEAASQRSRAILDAEQDPARKQLILQMREQAVKDWNGPSGQQALKELEKQSPQYAASLKSEVRAAMQQAEGATTMKKLDAVESAPVIIREEFATQLARESRFDESNKYLREILSRDPKKAHDEHFQTIAMHTGLMIHPSQLPERAAAIFKTIDSDGNKELTREELGQAVADPRWKSADSQAVAAMFAAFDDLKAEQGHAGITTDSLQDFGQKLATFEDRERVITTFARTDESALSRLDSDRDGKLSRQELPLPALALVELEKATANGGKIDIPDIMSVVRDARKADQKVVSAANQTIRLAEVDLSINAVGQPQHLYGSYSGPEGAIVPQAVRQGLVGDCMFEAGLLSLAATNPQAIDKMLKQNTDGTCTVTFGADPAHPVTVPPLTDTERTVYNRPGEFGTWNGVVAKAAGRYLKEHAKASGVTDQESVMPGTFVANWLITGEKMAMGFMPSDTEKVRQLLKDHMMNGKPTVVGAGLIRNFFDMPTRDKFQARHAFGVVSYDPFGPDGGTVILRDPHNDDCRGFAPATRELSVKRFISNFGVISK